VITVTAFPTANDAQPLSWRTELDLASVEKFTTMLRGPGIVVEQWMCVFTYTSAASAAGDEPDVRSAARHLRRAA
jgi:hypothetical protein